MLVIIIPLVLFLIKVKPEDIGLQPYGQEFYVKPEEGDEEQKQRVNLTFADSVRKPFFFLLMVGAVFVGISNNAGLGQFPPVVTDLHGATIAATIISVYSAVGIVGKLVLGQMNDLKGIVVSTLYASITLAFAYFLMLFSENIFIIYLMDIFLEWGMR